MEARVAERPQLRPRRPVMSGRRIAAGLAVGGVGIVVVFAILVAAATLMFRHSRKTKIDLNNVNADWEGGLAPTSERVETKTPVGV